MGHMTEDESEDAEIALIQWMKSQEIDSVDGVSLMLILASNQMGLGAMRRNKTREELIEGMHKLFSIMLIRALDAYELDPDGATEA